MEFNKNIEEYALDEYSKELFREWDREIFRHQAERAEKEALKRIKVAENNAKIAENKIKVAEKNSMIKIAKNLISKGMNLEFIVETTGLKKDEINHLIDQQNIVKG